MAQWPGRVLDPSIPEGRAECVLTVTDRALVAEVPGGPRFALALEALEFERQGFEAQVLAFGERGRESPRITTREQAVLDALRATAQPAVLRAIAAPRAESNSRLVRYWLAPALVVLALVAGAIWFVTGPLVPLATAALPRSADVAIGRLALTFTLGELGTELEGEQGDKARAAITAVLEPLTAGQDAAFEFDLHVVESDQVNAFALPGGPIVITTAMLKSAPSVDAVAGVLAHEVSHVTHRHGIRSMVQRLGISALVTAVAGDAGGLVTLLSDNAASFATLGFSRDMEREADRSGLALIARAGFAPEGLRAFFKSRLAEEEEQALKLPGFLSTHPATEDRIAELEALEKTLPAGASRPEVPWAQMLEALKAP